jgi:carbamoyltransferase
MKYVIGISAYYHDSSACLFKDGKLLFACEEEKFTGVKHDSSFPNNTIDYIFKTYKIKKEDISAVCYYEDPELKLKRVKENIKENFLRSPIHSIESYFKIIRNIKDLKKNLSRVSDNVFYSKHHLSHQYYSFFTSDFKRATCLSVDGVGEYETASVGFANGDEINTITVSEYPHSIGLFYSAMTSFLGFKPNEGEYKVMGLASYGDPNVYLDKVRDLIRFKNGGVKCNLKYFTWNKSNKIMFNSELVEHLDIQPRFPEEPIKAIHENLAASIQKVYEEVFFDLLKAISYIDDTGNICLSGGCAYNGSANGKILDNSSFIKLWIPVAPSDAGSAIGACIHYLVKNKELQERVTQNPFLGPIYFYRDIIKVLKNKKYHMFRSENKLRTYVAKKLHEGKVVGWFEGHCEFGARALGNRSILADPTKEGMKDRINKLIKKRENFRPFAPMVTVDDQNKYFVMVDEIPYMNQIVQVNSEYKDILKAVTHVDGTARVQSVHKNTNIYKLLREFEKLSGYPILLNTSFNIKDKTMVLTPKDALDTFYNTDLDILIIENFLIYK